METFLGFEEVLIQYKDDAKGKEIKLRRVFQLNLDL